jgi:hypothetical protein
MNFNPNENKKSGAKRLISIYNYYSLGRIKKLKKNES